MDLRILGLGLMGALGIQGSLGATQKNNPAQFVPVESDSLPHYDTYTAAALAAQQCAFLEPALAATPDSCDQPDMTKPFAMLCETKGPDFLQGVIAERKLDLPGGLEAHKEVDANQKHHRDEQRKLQSAAAKAEDCGTLVRIFRRMQAQSKKFCLDTKALLRNLLLRNNCAQATSGHNSRSI